MPSWLSCLTRFLSEQCRMTTQEPHNGRRRENCQAKTGRLQLAGTSYTLSEACRRHGVSRTQFCESKRRFQAQGLEGLKALPRMRNSPPRTAPAEIVEQILAMSLNHPGWGCIPLSDQLQLEGTSVIRESLTAFPSEEGREDETTWSVIVVSHAA
jgi:hypothetical protein